ncbi:MAG: hypothetical protein RLZZ504_1695 [Bacteroidota bacterium]|jgi:hypothetical protein
MIQQQIQTYLKSIPPEKRADLIDLQKLISELFPNYPLSFHTGYDTTGKQVSNPSIGYGNYLHTFSNGTTSSMYQIGLSVNNNGISIYLLGLSKSINIKEIFTSNIGKAQITGYCIKFKRLSEINLQILGKGLTTLYATAASN